MRCSQERYHNQQSKDQLKEEQLKRQRNSKKVRVVALGKTPLPSVKKRFFLLVRDFRLVDFSLVLQKITFLTLLRTLTYYLLM